MSFKVTHEASGINRLVSAQKNGCNIALETLTQTCMKLFGMETFDGCCWMGCDATGDRITFDCEEEFTMFCDMAGTSCPHLFICSSGKTTTKKVKKVKTNKCMAKVMTVSCPKTVVCDEEFTVECCFQNNGTKAWPEQCFWSFIRTKTCDPTSLPVTPLSLSGPVENGQETTVFLRLMAPQVPGTYFWRGRLASQADGKKKFGQIAKFCVTVTSMESEEACISCEKEKCEKETEKCGNAVPYTEEQKARVDEIRRKLASDPSVPVDKGLKAQLVMAKK